MILENHDTTESEASAEAPVEEPTAVGRLLDVSPLGGLLRFDGDPVGFLSRAVRLLRELVAMARLEQGDTSGDTANQSRDGANDAGDHIDVHSTDSTDGGER